MLKNILSPAECKKCRICCGFEGYELWETPIVSDDLKNQILADNPEQKFISKGKSWLFRMECENENELYFCPMLDMNTGCMLKDNKPFDCKIWPYRIMNLGGKRVITIASICPSMYSKPLSQLIDELNKTGLADKIFEEADKNPDIVKEYERGYPILLIEK